MRDTLTHIKGYSPRNPISLLCFQSQKTQLQASAQVPCMGDTVHGTERHTEVQIESLREDAWEGDKEEKKEEDEKEEEVEEKAHSVWIRVGFYFIQR